MKFIKRSLLLIALLGIATVGNAQIAVSTFDTDADGWTIGEFFGTAGGGIPSYFSAGGNPGGFIRTEDVFGWNAFHAPAKFLGNQSAAYGGRLSLDQRLLTSDGADYPMVIISDGTLTLQYRTSPPGTNWTTYNISLYASDGWELVNYSGNQGEPATETQLLQVLSNLTLLSVEGDWQTGADQIDLDNVRLDAGPALQISGQIRLQGAVNSVQPITLVFRPVDGGLEFQRSVTLGADGSYSLVHFPPKQFTVRAKGAKWLADTRTLNLTNGSVSGMDFVLRAGDANDDNTADIADLLLLINAYNQIAPATGYLEAADFNSDESNDIGDLLLLIGNYNQQGEEFP